MKNRIGSLLFGISVFLLILTVSIGLPIYCRGFYYLHIHALGLEKTGFSYEEIKEGYDQILNYLTLPGRSFGAGVFRFSEAGEAHFRDCKLLFDLNAGVLLGSAAVSGAILLLQRKKRLRLCRPLGFSPAFFSAIAAILLPLTVGGLAASDFDRAFVIFHHLFFPGKDNWTFDPRVDEIIRVLPEEFFRNCAILIGAGLLVFSITILTAECRKRAKRKAEAER